MKKWLLIICRLILAGVFIYAAVGKITNPSAFADAISGYRILPIAMVNIVAIILPWGELMAGIALFHRLTMKSGALVLLMLNMVFLVAAISAMHRGLNIECGCFTLSGARNRVGWELIARDSFFLILCLPIMVYREKSAQAITD